MEAEKQEKTDNELIAKFMGFKKNVFEPEFYVLPSTFNNGPFCSCESLLFDTSWDWLIPVIQKIKKDKHSPREMFMGTTLERDIQYTAATEIPMYTPIEVAHLRVVEFIKWYNSQGSTSSSTSE